jgi:hemolysin D
VVNADVLPSGQPGSRESRLAHRARIAVGEGALRGVPSHFRLLPGMEVLAEVKVGRRSVISYFLDPVLRVHDESLREL